MYSNIYTDQNLNRTLAISHLHLVQISNIENEFVAITRKKENNFKRGVCILQPFSSKR